ncbi:hypothetical protein HID58_087020 [Brassica napus]|uniref:Uncharacterized protein n=4 Tax=Brassica TaxID=3705 RepID=A0ABQ7XS72_BRANA|nr:hypothetical protein HID58_087020 [Brassica napus]VDD31180.1 unnamed protein product [Brassica oleracea]
MEMESSKVQEDTDQKTDPVLDNLKDYTVKTLVNFVDHLGTVASKLTDLFDQQSSDISTMEMRASCVSQQLLTCRTLLVLSDDLNQDRIIAMRQKWCLCEIDLEDYFFVLLTRLFQSIQRHIYLKEPMDKVTSAAIPLALAASSLYMINCVFMFFHVFLEYVMFFTEYNKQIPIVQQKFLTRIKVETNKRGNFT